MEIPQIPYPAYACAVAIAYLLPYISTSYYPQEAFCHPKALRLSKTTDPIQWKSYNSYTYRLLKMISCIGINKLALECINRLQMQFQDKICTTIVHILLDTRMVTVRDRHVRTATRALFVKPGLQFVEDSVGHNCDVVLTRAVAVGEHRLVFPPSRFRAVLLRVGGNTKWRVSVTSAINSAMVMQVFTQCILSEAAKICIYAKKRRITPDHVSSAMTSELIRSMVR